MKEFWRNNQITIIMWSVMLIGMAYVGIYRLNAVEERTKENSTQITEMGKFIAVQIEINKNTEKILTRLEARR